MLKLAYSKVTAKDKIRAALKHGSFYYHPRLWTAEYERAIGELIAAGEARWCGPEDLNTANTEADLFMRLRPVYRFEPLAAWKKVAYAALFTCALWGFVLSWSWWR